MQPFLGPMLSVLKLNVPYFCYGHLWGSFSPLLR